MMLSMRSTVRIDDDLMTALKSEAARQGLSLTRTLNRALRAGLNALRHDDSPRPPFRQRTAALGQSSLDLTRALGIAAELEDEETRRELALRK